MAPTKRFYGDIKTRLFDVATDFLLPAIAGWGRRPGTEGGRATGFSPFYAQLSFIIVDDLMMKYEQKEHGSKNNVFASFHVPQDQPISRKKENRAIWWQTALTFAVYYQPKIESEDFTVFWLCLCSLWTKEAMHVLLLSCRNFPRRAIYVGVVWWGVLQGGRLLALLGPKLI